MIKITVGTTPTIIYTFHIVSPSDFTQAVLTIKKHNAIYLRKNLEDAVVGENSLSWMLTQDETLGLGKTDATMMVNWLTADGVRGASVESHLTGVSNHINEVM